MEITSEAMAALRPGEAPDFGLRSALGRLDDQQLREEQT